MPLHTFGIQKIRAFRHEDQRQRGCQGHCRVQDVQGHVRAERPDRQHYHQAESYEYVKDGAESAADFFLKKFPFSK